MKSFSVSSCLLFISAMLVCGNAIAEDLFYDFEKNSPEWVAETGSTITQSSRHAKSGEKSLEWKWTSDNSTLRATFPPQLIRSENRQSTHLGLWVYNESPLDERLRVQAYSGGKEVASFWFNLDYRGWRAMGANYRLLSIPDKSTIDQLVFHAPSRSGTLWIDSVKPAFMSSPIRPDSIQPWADNPALLEAPPEKTRYSSSDISINRNYLPSFIPKEKIRTQAKRDMRRIADELGASQIDRRKAHYTSFDDLSAEFGNLGIIEKNSCVNGPPLEFDGGFHPLHGAISFKKKFLPVFEKLSESIINEQGSNKNKAEKMYITMCRYFLDQGFQEGNNNFGWIGNGYTFRHFPSRVFLHRDLLEKEDLLATMLKGVANLCMGREMFSENPYSSCDQLYNFSPHLPIAIALLPDEAERYQRMRAFKLYMDKVILNDRPIGKDGTIHHHLGHHLAYGGYTPPKMANTQILPFKGTEFFISPAAHEKLRTLAWSTAFQCMHGNLAPNLYLRSGVPINLSGAPLALPVAMLGTPDKSSDIDKDIAAIYLDALDGKETPEAKQFIRRKITPVRPSGNLSLNQAAISIHRRNDWQASAAGMIQCARGLEIYGWMENNNYGRQSRNGSLFLTVGEKTGWKREGWNWNFWPGATTSVFREASDLLEGYAMYSNSNNLGGGVSQNGNGVWGNNFSLHDLSFKKSIFFFDDKITVITTNISSSSDREVVTTLFQQSAEGEITTPTVNKRKIPDFKSDEKSPAALVDSLGNTYYIPAGSALNFQTSEQEWTYFFQSDLKDRKNNPCLDIRKKRFKENPLAANAKYYTPTKGKFHLAYLSHGNSPKSASCTYTILMQPSEKLAGQFLRAMNSTSPPVKILAQNSKVHAVYDSATKTTGYVIFDPSANLPPPLKKSSRPGFIMVRNLENGYKISLATGDPEQNKEFGIELQDGSNVTLEPNYPLSGSKVVGTSKQNKPQSF